VITEDLTGFRPADKLIAEGVAFETLLGPTAELAARLHNEGLHHRDLYLCHFFVRLPKDGAGPELRLIDAARVRALPRFLTRRRWIVKDLGQFWYSTQGLAVTEEQRERWLARYAELRRGAWREGLGGAVRRKARAIARHDAKLRRSQPKRNVSLGQ
jgi:heptose I phosphotransferase